MLIASVYHGNFSFIPAKLLTTSSTTCSSCHWQMQATCAFACCCTFIKQLPLNPLTDLLLLLHSSWHSRKMHLPFAVCINHTQNYDARLMANKSGANSRKHWRHSIVVVDVVVSAARSACRMRKGSHKSVEFGSAQLALLLLLLVLHHLLCSCVQLHSAHSQLPFAVLNLVRLHRQRQRDWQSAWLSHYATVWQSDNLTVLAAWLLGFRATQAASLCAPVAACNLQLPVHTNLPLSNLLATAAAASSLSVLAVVVAPKCTLLFFKSQQADDNNTSWN